MSDKETAIEKALRVLLAFKPNNRPMGTGELSKKLGYHKATASRILLTLAEHGFVFQDPNTKKFSLGANIYELGTLLAETSINTIVRVARPHITALRNELDETIVLEVWSGDRTVVAYEEESVRPLKVGGQVGTPPPVHVTAGAKAILSVSDLSRVDASLKGEMKRYTENTIVDRDVFKARLAEYKQQGFATDRDEFDVGISAIGAPIFGHHGEAVAAVVVLIPSARFSEDSTASIARFLLSTTKTISDKFSYLDAPETLNGKPA
ncbi:MAG: IclR family transcriptional regulator [Anaerolineae bacterium]